MYTPLNEYTFELLVITGVLLDLILGDPRWFPHPVRGIGWLCVKFELLFRDIFTHERRAGTITVIAVIASSMLLLALLFLLTGWLSVSLQIFFALLFFSFCIAIKDLLVHSRDVYDTLTAREDIASVRKLLSRIVGRDTDTLDREDISRACVETVAENMVDGITAPIFWAFIFSFLAHFCEGDPFVFAVMGMIFYKSVNTMDSMFGYKNEKYVDFGRTAARLDDFVNLLPARISGYCIVAGAFFTALDWQESLRIYLRDRHNHSSPNAGHPEAALAGALHIQLGGVSQYFGEIVEKPTLGERTRNVTPHDILLTNRLVFISSLLFLLLLLLVRRILIISSSLW